MAVQDVVALRILERLGVALVKVVVQSLRKSGSMHTVIVGALPFVLALFAMVGLLAAFPALALWLPSVFGN